MKYFIVLAIGFSFAFAGCSSGKFSTGKLAANPFSRKKDDNAIVRNLADGPPPGKQTASEIRNEYANGEAALKDGNLKKADAHFKAVVKSDPKHADAHHRLAYIADKNEQFTMAELHYMSALRLRPSPDIACDLGYSYLLQDRLDDSQRYLEQALNMNPRHQASLLNMATLYGKQGNYSGALAMFRQAGNEQEAQANIARLFPDGPPAGQATQLAGNSAPDPWPQNAANRQQQSPQFAQRQHQNRQQPQPPNGLSDWSRIDPRTVPDHEINNIFAQIDAQYEQQRIAAPPISPDNGSGYRQQPAVAQNQPFPPPQQSQLQQARTQQSQMPSPADRQNRQEIVNTVPGQLPVGRSNDPYQDFAVLPAAGQAPPAGTDQFAQLAETNPELTNPFFQAEPTQNSEPVSQAPLDRSAQPQPPGNGALNLTAPGVPPRRMIQNPGLSPFPNRSAETADPFANLNQPNPPVMPTDPNNPAGMQAPQPTSDSQAGAVDYQAAANRALQIGMNAGPGQIFPASPPAGQNSPPQNPILPQQQIQPTMQAPFDQFEQQPPVNFGNPAENQATNQATNQTSNHTQNHTTERRLAPVIPQAQAAPDSQPRVIEYGSPNRANSPSTNAAPMNSAQFNNTPTNPPPANRAPLNQTNRDPAGLSTMPISVNPAATAGPQTVPQWPYAPPQQQSQSTIGQIQQPTPSAATSHYQNAPQTPWDRSSSSSHQTQNQPQADPDSEYHIPQQWPHSPQHNTGQPPLIHRGSQPQNPQPTNTSYSTSGLPAIVPGSR